MRNAMATGEFVCNLATAALAEGMNKSSASVPAEVDEFALAQLATAPCQLVRPLRVADAPAALECKVLDIINLRDLDRHELGHYLTIGQVVGVHIDERYLTDGLFDTARAVPLARCGYHDYAVVKEVFAMLRPGES